MARILLAIVLFFAIEDPTVWSGVVELPGGTKLEFSVELKKDSGTISIPMQGAKDMPLSGVSVTDKELKFSIPEVGASWELAIADDGQTATGVLRQGAELKTTMTRLAAGEAPAKELVRPQEPKPPFPYDAHEVEFDSAGGTLAGTLTVPRGEGPFPCVVMVSGSGPQDRDEALMGHRPFLVIADHLTRHGIAVLRYDDRGVGKSTGSFEKATSDDFAEDALAAVAFLGLRKEIDDLKIGIVGHSEGGLIAPICAAGSKDVAFIVLLAGTGITGWELMPIQGKLIGIASGVPPDEAERQAKASAEIFALVMAGKSDREVREAIRVAIGNEIDTAPETKDLPRAERKKKADEMAEQQSSALLSPWFRRFLVMDPRENLKKVTCPVLALNGEKDLQVPPKENLSEIEKALKAAGNKDVTCLELKGLNHLFQTCKTGAPSEYAEIAETFSPMALEAMTSWIRKRTGLD
ncbi:MAG: alpha/beta hydrolase family protein [Planctomycetota bacterium]